MPWQLPGDSHPECHDNTLLAIQNVTATQGQQFTADVLLFKTCQQYGSHSLSLLPFRTVMKQQIR